MFDFFEIISALTRWCASEAREGDDELAQAIGLDLSNANFIHTRDGRNFSIENALLKATQSRVTVAGSTAPSRQIEFIIDEGGPTPDVLDDPKFQLDRTSDDSRLPGGRNIRFTFEGARVGIGIAKSSGRIGIIAVAPIGA